MAKQHEFHPDFSKFPATGIRARQLGELLYFTGKRCTIGHLSTRYASSGNCSECIALKRGKTELNHKGCSSKRTISNQNKAMIAFEDGSTFYESDSQCPNGHYKRFITSNNCVDCGLQTSRDRAKKAKWARIKKEYGLEESDVALMLEKQGCHCLICGTNIHAGYHIDHCHSTGKVRGLLCSKCNQAIGLLKEDEELFSKAANYIRSHRAP
jgi:hypothetical protein